MLWYFVICYKKPAIYVKVKLPKRENILQASEFKSRGNISYADCFVIDLAKVYKGIIVTGDKEFENFVKKGEIMWLD